MNCKRAFFLLVLFSFFAFCGCKNFLNGKEILSEINQSVEYANASETTVVVTTNYGNVLNNGERKLKKGDTLQLNYSEGTSGYQFVKWDVEPAKSVSFVEAGGINLEAASVKIENTSQKITIKPVLYERPKIDTGKSEPAYVNAGVEKNNSIYLTFTKKLSENNDLTKIRIEKLSSGGSHSEILYGNEDSNDNNFNHPKIDNFDINIISKRDNFFSVEKETETVRVIIPSDFYYEIDGYKINFGTEQYYEYKVNNQTLEKLEVSFSCDGGTINPNERMTYNKGTEFSVLYTKSEDYNYNDWSVSVDEYIVEKVLKDETDKNNVDGYYKAWAKSEKGEKIGEAITFLSYKNPEPDVQIILEKENMYKIEFTVLENMSGVSIKPVTTLIPKIIDYEPKYETSGCAYDRKIQIYFNKKISETITKENLNDYIIIKDNESQKDYSEYYKDNINQETVNGKTVLTLSPLYDIKNLLSGGKDHIDINIALSDKFTDENGNTFDGNKNWYYRINNQAEENVPVIESIHLFSDSDPQAYFYRELTQTPRGDGWSDKSENDTDFPTTLLQFGDYSRNHVSKIYICVQGYDEGSGIGYLRVKEKQENDVAVKDYKFEGSIVDEEKQIYEFKQLHDLQIYDGDVVVEISLVDKVGNESLVEKYDVIKETVQRKYEISSISVEIISSETSGTMTTINKYLNGKIEKEDLKLSFYQFDISSPENYINDYFNDYLKKKLNSLLVIEIKNGDSIQKVYEGFYIKSEEFKQLLNNMNIPATTEEIILSVYSETGICDKQIFSFPSKLDNVNMDPIISNDNIYKITITPLTLPEKDNDEYSIFYPEEIDETTGKLKYKYSLRINTGESCSINVNNEINNYLKSQGKINFYILRNVSKKEFKGYPFISEITYYYNDNYSSSGSNTNIYISVEDTDYPKNTSLVNVTTNLNSLNINGSQYRIKCSYYLSVDRDLFGDSYFYSPQFTLKSQYKYNLYLINPKGNIVDNIEFDATEYDNQPPVFYSNINNEKKAITTSLNDNVAPNYFRIENTIKDNKTKINKVTYIVPPLNNYSKGNYIYFNISDKLYKMIPTEEDLEYVKQNWLHGVINVEKDYYDIPSFNNDLILYIEDESGNYDLAYSTAKIQRYNYLPELEYESEKFNVKLPENISETLSSKSFYYTIQNITLNEKKWNSLSENEDSKDSTFQINNHDNDFIRLFVCFNSKTSFLVPLYFCPAKYKDGFVSKNHSWFKVENGYQVFTDAPTLCHTMFAPTKLTETNKTEDAYVWESTGMETGILVTDTMFTYSDDQTDEVPSGFYYATICHFADGTILMSDVKLKE